MSKKYVMINFLVHESDALKNYLEDMALQGWKLEKIGNVFLHFTSCPPHPVRYCVEIMERPSVYASNQTPAQKGYREFCEEAGWDYVGYSGYFHVFRTEDPDVADVETDPEMRCQHIIQAEGSNSKMIAVLFGLIALPNLLACYREGTVLNVNGLCVLLLLGASGYTIGSFLSWKRRADITLSTAGTLPSADWRTVRLKNTCWTVGILAIAFIYVFWTLGSVSSSEYFSYAVIGFVIWLLFFFLLLLFFSRILRWLREKRAFSNRMNILIYWGSGLILLLILLGIVTAVILRLS